MDADFSSAIKALNASSDAGSRAPGAAGRRSCLPVALVASAVIFIRHYWIKNARKEGVPGLFLSVRAALLHFLTDVKRWEAGKASSVPMDTQVSAPKGAPGRRETVSAVVMTKNCEDLVEGTLKSVASWVDEIVVIDGYSSDRTVEICRRYTDKVFQNKWDGYRFCTERNLGNQKATMDWCFHVDPDERATPGFARAVREILEKGTAFNAFEFRKKNIFLGRWMRHGGWYHYSLHFFRRGKARYDGVIHEKLFVDGDTGRIEADVEHYPFTSIAQFLERHNGYSTREALALREGKKPVSDKALLYNLKTKPLKRFFKFYVKKKGFLDGSHGLVFSVLFAWVHFLNWVKYWELVRGGGKR